VAESNKYDCINYSYVNIYKDISVIGFNSGHFNNNVLFPYFYNPPQRYVEGLIGTLTRKKMIKIRSENGICLKLLDLMNFALPQSLEKFVQNFGDKGCEIKEIFP
jgi:hypothetical protein